MADRSHVCFSSGSAPKVNQEDQTATSVDNLGGTLVAKKTMVFSTSRPVSSETLRSHTVRRPPAPGSSPSSASSEIAPDQVALEKRDLLDLGLSTEVTSTIMSSRRDSTVRIYNHT